jgi:mRNA interferase MazF
MRRGEVYLARLDPTAASEQAGSRPVIIVSRDAINRASPVVIVVPCTTWSARRRLYPSQVLIRAPDGGLRAHSLALGEQVRALSKRRLMDRWGALQPETLRRLERALQIAMDLPGQYDDIDQE